MFAANELVVSRQGDGGIWHCESVSAVAGDMYRFVLESTWNDCYDTEGKTLFRRDPYARFCPVATQICASSLHVYTHTSL